MEQDRRKYPRYQALTKAVVDLADRRFEALCTNVGPGGAWLASRELPTHGAVVQVALRLTGRNTPTVWLQARVAHVLAQPQGARPQGFGVAWRSAQCSAGEEALSALLANLLRVTDLRALRADPGGEATFTFPDSQVGIDTDQAGSTALRDDVLGGARDRSVARSVLGAARRPRVATRSVQVVAAPDPGPAQDEPAPVAPPRLRRRSSQGYVLDGEACSDAAVAEPNKTVDSSGWPHGVPRSLGQRYSTLELLGQGGNGVVYSAWDTLRDRKVVLKFMAPGLLAEDLARRYFLREFQLAAQLDHPNIVRLFDLDVVEGVLYQCMEHLDGHPLSAWTGSGKPLGTLQFVLSVTLQLASALDYAHSQGVVHRDVKPNNVLVLADGRVKLFDFGLARLQDQGFGDQSVVVGAPRYMAPERILGRTVDGQADQYALGVVLFRMLTGQLPFATGDLLLAHVQQPPPDPTRLNPRLPPAVGPVLARALAKAPAERFPSCRSLAEALRLALGA